MISLQHKGKALFSLSLSLSSFNHFYSDKGNPEVPSLQFKKGYLRWAKTWIYVCLNKSFRWVLFESAINNHIFNFVLLIWQRLESSCGCVCEMYCIAMDAQYCCKGNFCLRLSLLLTKAAPNLTLTAALHFLSLHRANTNSDCQFFPTYLHTTKEKRTLSLDNVCRCM